MSDTPADRGDRPAAVLHPQDLNQKRLGLAETQGESTVQQIYWSSNLGPKTGRFHVRRHGDNEISERISIVASRSASELPADGAPIAINLCLRCKRESGRRQGFSNDQVCGGLSRPLNGYCDSKRLRHADLGLGGGTELLERGLDDRLIQESMGRSDTSNKPLEWTGRHQRSASQPKLFSCHSRAAFAGAKESPNCRRLEVLTSTR
jgi:hypothetical protein